MLNFEPTEHVQCVFWNRTVTPPTLLWCFSGAGATLRGRSCPLPSILKGELCCCVVRAGEAVALRTRVVDSRRCLWHTQPGQSQIVTHTRYIFESEDIRHPGFVEFNR